MLATDYVSMYVASYVTMVMMLLLMYDGHKDKSQVERPHQIQSFVRPASNYETVKCFFPALSLWSLRLTLHVELTRGRMSSDVRRP